MKQLQDIIEDLRTSATSCRQEASGNLDENAADRRDGLACIADSLNNSANKLLRLQKRVVLLTPKQRDALIWLAGNAERDDLIAALSKE